MNTHHLNVQAAIAQEQSIVRPTLPGNVLSEFQKTVNERKGANNAANTDNNNPFKQNQNINPSRHWENKEGLWEKDSYAIPKPSQPPSPPQNQVNSQMNLDTSVNTQPQQQQQNSYVPRFDMTQESTGILARSPENFPTPNLQSSSGSGSTREDQSSELKGTIKGIMRKRYEAGNMNPYTVGELSAEIKNSTQKSWGGYWVHSFGPLANFLRSNSDAFTMIRNKYVVPAGMESQFDIPTAPTPQQQTYAAQNNNDNYTQHNRNLINSHLPLNVLAQQQQQQQQQNRNGLHMIQPQPYNSFNQPYQQMDPFNNQPPMDPYNPYTQPNPYDPYDQPPSQYGNPYGANSNPFQGNDISMYGETQQATLGDLQNQINDPFFSQPLPGTSGVEYQMQQLQVNDDFYNPNPFDLGVARATPSTGVEDDFWKVDGGAFDENPLAIFETDNSGAATVQEGLKSEDQERLRKIRQENEDEAYARKLQDEELKAASSKSTSSSSNDKKEKKHSTRIVYDAKQIREIAENEIGRDNVRIMAGFSVIKYGREGRPHQRKMWINSSLTHLAWESGQYDGSHRGLELAKVRMIRVGEMTKTISRSTKDYKKVRNLCFSLETTQRTLDLQACSIIQRDSLVAALRKVVEFNHKHKPVRKDRNRTEISVFVD